MRLLNEKSVLPYVEGDDRDGDPCLNRNHYLNGDDDDDAFQAASEEFLNQINIQFLSFKIN